MPVLQAAPSRAPPLHITPQPRAEPTDHAAVRRTIAWRAGLIAGSSWSLALLATLWHLGRVPLLEATLWSLLSGTVLWRTVTPALRAVLDHYLRPASIELGMRDPLGARVAVAKALQRRGYVLQRHRLTAETFKPRRWAGLNPCIRIAWSGPGAIVDGPRWLVRLVARISVT